MWFFVSRRKKKIWSIQICKVSVKIDIDLHRLEIVRIWLKAFCSTFVQINIISIKRLATIVKKITIRSRLVVVTQRCVTIYARTAWLLRKDWKTATLCRVSTNLYKLLMSSLTFVQMKSKRSRNVTNLKKIVWFWIVHVQIVANAIQSLSSCWRLK